MTDPHLGEWSTSQLLDELARRFVTVGVRTGPWRLLLHLDGDRFRKAELPALAPTHLTMGRSAVDLLDDQAA